MYRVRPYYRDVDIGYQSSTMYKIKPYVSLANQEQQSSPPTADIEELFKIQDKQLRKLEQLAKKTNELCEELHFDNLVVKVETRAEQQKSSSAVNSAEIEELYKKQEAQFKRLSRLSGKLNQLCEELNLPKLVTHLQIETSKSSLKNNEEAHRPRSELPNKNLEQFKNVARVKSKVNISKSIEDIVIKLDPQYVPCDLLTFLVDHMTLQFKCFIRFHTHVSAMNDVSNNRFACLGEFFDKISLGLNESRLAYDFGFTFIWMKSSGIDKPFITVNEKDFIGEEKIVEYMNTLLPQNKKLKWADFVKNKSNSKLFKALKDI